MNQCLTICLQQLFPFARLYRVSLAQPALTNQFIQPATLFFDNAVGTKKELLDRWIVPMQQSWLGRRYLVNI